MIYTLRPATEADYNFLYRLKVVCLKEYVAGTWGWDEAFQRAHFASVFDPSGSQIVMLNGRDVGQLAIEEEKGALFIGGIFVLPAYQGCGLGTQIIKDVLDKALGKGRFVRLQVLKVNPARQLYESLGFHIYDETETHYLMHNKI